jgi:hypothetical protein
VIIMYNSLATHAMSGLEWIVRYSSLRWPKQPQVLRLYMLQQHMCGIRWSQARATPPNLKRCSNEREPPAVRKFLRFVIWTQRTHHLSCVPDLRVIKLFQFTCELLWGMCCSFGVCAVSVELERLAHLGIITHALVEISGGCEYGDPSRARHGVWLNMCCSCSRSWGGRDQD